MQKNACHDFAEKKGWNIVGEEQEIGVSGYKVSTDDLVKLKRIRKAAEQGEFDILLVFMYDRLGRNLNKTPFIAEWFTKKGIHVWSVYEGEIIDGVVQNACLTTFAFGRLMRPKNFEQSTGYPNTPAHLLQIYLQKDYQFPWLFWP